MSTKITLRENEQLEIIALPEQAEMLVGHQENYSSLIEQAKNKKLPGAILLHGQRGIGKASFAFLLAREIFALSGDESDSQIDEQVAQGSYPNLFILRKSPKSPKGFYSEIRINDVREIQKRMQKTRGRAGHRICIIDSIDDCNQKSSNALLKLLEEPPADTMFILISHRPGSLLPTIHSRCHSYAFRTLDDEQVREITNIALGRAEVKDIDTCIKLANGIPRRAIEAALFDELSLLKDLGQWLISNDSHSSSSHLTLAENIVKSQAAEQVFAHDMIIYYISDQANFIARKNPKNRVQLASITKLWEKANNMFADSKEYNLDKKQTLVSIFDAIIQYKQLL